MNNKFLPILSIIISFVLSVVCLTFINGMVSGGIKEIIVVDCLIIGFYFFTDSGASLLGYMRAEARRKKIQADIDTEKAFRKMGG